MLDEDGHSVESETKDLGHLGRKLIAVLQFVVRLRIGGLYQPINQVLDR